MEQPTTHLVHVLTEGSLEELALVTLQRDYLITMLDLALEAATDGVAAVVEEALSALPEYTVNVACAAFGRGKKWEDPVVSGSFMPFDEETFKQAPINIRKPFSR